MLLRLRALARYAALALMPCIAIGASPSHQAAKPKCTRKLRGEMWPAAANSDPTALQRAARSGKLEVCAATAWRYRWQSMTVTAAQLAREYARRAGRIDRANHPAAAEE